MVPRWYAQQMGRSFVVLAEHRFYGASVPQASFEYLTVEQSLADYHAVVEQVSKFIAELFSLDAPPKAVCFGGSYGGILSTLLRLKYPETFTAVCVFSSLCLFVV